MKETLNPRKLAHTAESQKVLLSEDTTWDFLPTRHSEQPACLKGHHERLVTFNPSTRDI